MYLSPDFQGGGGSEVTVISLAPSLTSDQEKKKKKVALWFPSEKGKIYPWALESS